MNHRVDIDYNIMGGLIDEINFGGNRTMPEIIRSIVAAVLCVLLVAYWWYSRKQQRDRSQQHQQKQQVKETEGLPLPGPEPNDAKTGNLDLIKEKGSVLEFLVWLHKTYGPMAGFWMGDVYYVSTASVEAFKAQAHLFNRPAAPFKPFEPLIGETSIQFANYVDGKNRRRLHDRSYRQEPVDNFVPEFAKVAEEMISKWDDKFRKRAPLTAIMSQMAFKGISRFAFGDYFKDEAEVDRFRELYNEAIDSIVDGMLHGGNEPGTEKYEHFLKIKNEMLTYVKKVIRERSQDENREEEFKVFLDGILETYADENMVANDIITYLVAGFHTTAFTMVWCLYHLMLEPELQDRAYDGVRKALAVSGGVYDKNTIKEIGFLSQCVDETLRFCGPGPFAARYFEQDTVVCGYRIPARVPVLQTLFAIFLDEKYFPEPEKFDPDRFSAERVGEIPKLAFAPFGFAGGRQCPGYKVAVTESITYLAVLLSKYKFTLLPDQKVEKSYDYAIVKPKEEIWFTAEERKV